MAVFRIERTRDYTVMSNHHLRNEKLSLKAKGLLSMMLSLPDDWNYTTRGLAKICKEGVDAIGGALRELETAGYIVRHQLRDRYGRISDTEYVIYEQPQPRQPDTPQPDTASPDTENPYMDKPDTEKPAESNIEKSITQKSITHGSSTDSIPFRETAAAEPPERKGRDAMSLAEIESYRELILENIEYDCIKQQYGTYRDDLDEIVELMVETVCAKRKTTRIAGSDFPHEVVRSRFLKLDSSHIEFVMDCLKKNTTEIRNMKQNELFDVELLFHRSSSFRLVRSTTAFFTSSLNCFSFARTDGRSAACAFSAFLTFLPVYSVNAAVSASASRPLKKIRYWIPPIVSVLCGHKTNLHS